MRAFRQAWVAILLLAGLGMQSALAAEPLVLSSQQSAVLAWPAVTVLSDPTRALEVHEILPRLNDFKPPAGPQSNLGVRNDVVWLRIPVTVPWFERAQWVMDIDYPTLNHADVYVVRSDGMLLRRVELGSALPFSKRLMPSRTPALALTLAPSESYDILVRVDTKTSAIVPISFLTQEGFYERGVHEQMVQGLIAGVSLFLFAFSLIYWLSLRDAVFFYYGVANACVAMFFFAQFGLASQYLWPDSPWLAIHAAPLAILLALAAASLFVDRVLRVSEWSRAAAGLLHAVAAAAVVAALLGVVETIDYRVVQTIATLLGPVPMAVILGASVAQLRRGDRVAAYMLVGWGAYAAGAGVLVALLRGWIDATPWTQHAFQVATLIEMGMWLRVLSLRMEEIRETAHRAQIERNTLNAMAHTDPLTGLPNRRGLDQTLPSALAKASPDQMVAVFLLDLDDFKPINDRLGHDAGDEVLVAVAQRLQALLRTSDTVARLGGDEFVVVAGGLHGDQEAQQLGAKLLEGFHRPFIAAGEACHVGLTIGYALAPQDGRDAAQLLQRADGAMYAGKRAGRHSLQRSETPLAELPA